MVLDGSTSIGSSNFDLIKIWLENFVTQLNNEQGLGSTAVRFGLVSETCVYNWLTSALSQANE